MDNVLVVDGDETILEKLEKFLSGMKQFRVVTASDGQAAMDILEREKISVLATGLNLSGLEGLDLVANITRNRRSMPCIVMSDFGKPWFYRKTDQTDNLYYLKKPVEPSALFSAVVVALSLNDEGMSNQGFELRSFLPLIELDNKSCRLEVAAKGGEKGFLYFENGVLIDAHCGNRTPHQAVEEMIDWDGVSISISELPIRHRQKRMSLSVIELAGATLQEGGGPAVPEFRSKDDEPKDLPEKSEKRDWKEEAAELFSMHLERYRTIKGYRAMGIVDSEFLPVLGDGLHLEIDLAHPPVGIDFLFNASSAMLKRREVGEAETIMITTAHLILQILRAPTTGPETFYIVGITDATGNWLFMRHEMEALGKKTFERSAG